MMPLLTVILPANAGIFFAQIMHITAFEVFDTKPYLDSYLRLEPADPVNANFEAVGLESIYFPQNLGTLLLAFVFYLVMVILSKLLLLCSEDEVKVNLYSPCPSFNECGKILHRNLFWGSLINLVTEAYSMMTLSCMINLKYLRWDSFSLIFMSSLSILVTLVLLAYPAFFAWELTKDFDSLETWHMRKKYGKWYEDLDLRNGKMVLLQPIWLLVRRFIMSVMVVFLSKTVILQIALMTLTIIVQVVILGRI